MGPGSTDSGGGVPTWKGGRAQSATVPLVSVIVPIHDALVQVERCLQSLVAHSGAAHWIFLIDDCSTDPRILPLLESAKAVDPRVRVVRHERNVGYTATINQGCRLASPDDIILLNSDTEVTPRWIEKLREVSTEPEGGRVATVTPLSNAAGAFSVPLNHRVNRLPVGVTPAGMAEVVERLSDGIRPRVPTGNGFCLYVRREALDAVGPFDEAAFPSGYGEENDFCVRASRLGYVHRVDDTTYVHHHRGASMGSRRRWLILRSSWILRRRYPEYRPLVAAWLADDPLDPLRRRIQEHLAARGGPIH